MDTERGKFINQCFIPDSIEDFRFVQNSPKWRSKENKELGEEKKMTSKVLITKDIFDDLRCFHIFLQRVGSKNLKRTQAKVIER